MVIFGVFLALILLGNTLYLPLKKLVFHTEGVELNNVQIAPLKEQWFYGRVSSHSTSTLR